MANIFRKPTLWVGQSSQPLRISSIWSDAFVYAFTGPNSRVVSGVSSGFASGLRGTFTASTSRGPLRGRKFTASGSGDALTLSQSGLGNTPTYLAVVLPQTPQNYSSVIDHADKSGLQYVDGSLKIVANAGTFYNNGFNPPLINNAVNAVVATQVNVGGLQTTGNFRTAINGVLYTSTVPTYSTDSSTAGGACNIGVNWYSVDRTFAGGIFLVACWRRTFTDTELVALSNNPWQIFEEDRRSIFLGGGVTPPAFTGTAISAGGGAAKSVGTSQRTTTAISAGGGAAKSVGTSQRTTTAKSAGGGVARSAGTSSKSGTAKSIGGGAARGIGSGAAPVSGSAKSIGGGATAGAGTGARVGSAKSAGGGSARAQGIGANLGVARVAGGGTAKPVSQGSPGHTGSAVSFGGGAARAIGVQNVGILGTARTAGGGAAVSPTLANRIGWAIAGGGGAARATAQGATHSGFAAAAGGGAAKAFGAVTPPPSSVDHYIHGWPVSKSGAVIVRIMP